MNRLTILLTLILLTHSGKAITAQSIDDRGRLDSLVDNKSYEAARELLEDQLTFHISEQQYDSLQYYPDLAGSIYASIRDTEAGVEKAEEIISLMKTNKASPLAVHDALIDFMHFLDDQAMVQRSYEVTMEAANLARSTPGFPVLETGNTLYNLGAGALALGNFYEARDHFREALSYFLKDTLASAERLPDAYNAMGAMMWSETKLDSALFYYNKSIASIGNTEKDSLEKSYLQAITMSNVGLIEQSKGETNEAIRTLEETLRLYGKVIRNSKDDDLVSKSKRYRLNVLTSLAIVYNDMGNYQLSNVFLRSVLDLQKDISPEKDPAIFQAMINLGESELSLREYAIAALTFRKAISQIDSTPGEYPYWKAIALANLAQAENVLGNDSLALVLFEESETHFNKALGDAFDRQYLHLRGHKIQLFSELNLYEKALDEAEKTIDYLEKSAGKETPLLIQHQLNIARIFLEKEEPVNAYKTASKALDIINNQTEKASNIREKIQAERFKPMALLIQNKASYQMQNEPDSVVMLELLKELQFADSLLDNRKTLFPQEENINALIDENKEFYDWKQFLTVRLYMITGNKKYLNDLIDRKEQSIYNSIRLEFFRRSNMAFHNVPDSIMSKENELITLASEMNSEIENPSQNKNGKIPDYLEKWQEYLNMIRKSYPDYYQLRFGQISNIAKDVQENLSEHTSIIRYIFIRDELHALVINKDEIIHYNLGRVNVEEPIGKLNTFLPEEEELEVLSSLYQQIWQALKSEITSDHVLIIPDGALFNLSFASLPTTNINSYRELSENSLVNEYYISYDFALSLQTLPTRHEPEYSGNYIAFVPGFSRELKEKLYTEGVEGEDNIYMELLHQPFIVETAKYVRSRFGGKVIAGEASTRSGFLENAGGQTIMHIGTHAEINNISPSYSRLFFTKTSLEPDNQVFAYEIYNHHFPSHLTILTACDTGKPGYRPGEGMTSLAHAFHYAGSRSLLMSLWKIDEQTSSFITQKFFDHLSKGHNKAEALSMAKNDYLKTARGRTLAPVYWAGIVVTGDNSPVHLTPKRWISTLIWSGTIIIILSLIIWSGFFRKQW